MKFVVMGVDEPLEVVQGDIEFGYVRDIINGSKGDKGESGVFEGEETLYGKLLYQGGKLWNGSL